MNIHRLKPNSVQATVTYLKSLDVAQISADIVDGIPKNRIVSCALVSETILIVLGLPLFVEEKMLFLLGLVPYGLSFHPAYVTQKAYKQTREFIEKTGTLRGYMSFATRKHRQKGRYFEYYLAGYCELQGMYLAAKEMGKLEEFFELKKEFAHNIIPNF